MPWSSSFCRTFLCFSINRDTFLPHNNATTNTGKLTQIHSLHGIPRLCPGFANHRNSVLITEGPAQNHSRVHGCLFASCRLEELLSLSWTFMTLTLLKITDFVECLPKVSSWSDSGDASLAETSQQWHCVLLAPRQGVHHCDLFLY